MRPLHLVTALATSAMLLLSPSSTAQSGEWTLVAYNDLGMHCMDSDYSVFSILPPFNNVFAQLIRPNGDLVTNDAGFTLTYEAVADPLGSLNTTSAGKTNYWTYAPALYGASGVPNTGLTGNDMPGPGNVPQPMTFDAARSAWFADGIPLTPTDDAGHRRTYPLMKLVARDGAGTLLASVTPVLPVSTEMDCRACHASGSQLDAMPAGGWVYEKKAERDYRFNILRLHDEQHLGEPLFDDALVTLGNSTAGLEATARGGKPILCASCHASNALPGTGLPGIPQLTSSIHDFHGPVTDPTNGMTLESSDNRSSCYRCHPGSETRCLRGAMGAAVAPNGDLSMQCQSCHGSMSAVGNPARTGWLEQPNCQACHTGTATHNNGQIRYDSALLADGSLRVAVDATFATDADAPLPGFSLYRFSDGHGDLHCSSCHGSTHAEFPAAHPNDNLAPDSIQGHSGMLVECNACHVSNLNSASGGPHGMHSIGNWWIEHHHDYAEGSQLNNCRKCHGADSRGTVLSMAQGNRTFATGDYGTKTYFDGSIVSCYGCHNGPTSENPTPNTRPTAQNAAITVSDVPVPLTLVATDPNGDALSYRIVSQPAYGRVALSGNQATYIPDPGFAGRDSFTWAAYDTKVDSNLASVLVTRTAGWGNYSYGYPGTGGVVPAYTSGGAPALGSTVPLAMQNTSGAPALTFFFASLETAQIDTKFGGVLLTEPVISATFVLPGTGLLLPFPVPSDPTATGVSLYTQTIQQDAGASFGYAFSRGLRLTVGQ